LNSEILKRRLNILEIANEGIRLFIRRAADFSLLWLTPLIPLIVTFVVLWLAGKESAENRPTGVIIVLIIVMFTISAIANIFALTVTAIIAEAVVKNQSVSLAAAAAIARAKFNGVFSTTLLTGIIVAGLSLLFVIPGIIYGVFYQFAVYAAMLRNRTGRDALSFSKSLVDGQWWTIFLTPISIAVIFALVVGVISLLLELVLPSAYVAIIQSVLTSYLGALVNVIILAWFLNVEFARDHRLANQKRLKKQKALRTKGRLGDVKGKKNA
jgi:hypothetical protein